jgi:hypothetical protein
MAGKMTAHKNSCPDAIFSTTNSAQIAIRLTPGFHSEKSVSNHLNYGIVIDKFLSQNYFIMNCTKYSSHTLSMHYK